MKIFIFIDGANFYYGLRSVDKNYSDLNFDFEKYFNKEILKKDEEIIKVFYYNAPLKNTNGDNKLYAKQQQFFKRLEHTKNFKVVLCKRQKRFTEKGKEYHIIKGDDIHLAVDLVKTLYEEECDKIILVSGDGDFVPAIKLAKDKNKIINISYFKNSISQNIYNISNEKFLIDKKIVNKYFFRGKK